MLFFVPLGKADLSLGNQFIQLILQPGQTQDPFTISNATGSTLLKIDANATLTINDAGGNPSTVVGPRSGVEAASYIIFTDGTNVYAKNGTTGKVEFSGTDAATVINTAIANVNTPTPAGYFGGTVFIKKSKAVDYNITSPITMLNRVDVICEKDAVLKAGASLNPLINIISTTAGTDVKFKISNCRLEGNSLVGTGIAIANNSYVHIDTLEIYGMNSFGIDLRGGSTYEIIENSIIQAPTGGIAIRITRIAGMSQGSNENLIRHNRIFGTGQAIALDGDVYGNIIIGNQISTNATKGIDVSGDGTFTPTLNIIEENWFELGVWADVRAIQIEAVSPYNTMPRQTVIEKNHFGNYGIGIFNQYGNNTVIRDNYFSGVTQNLNDGSTSLNTHIDNLGLSPYNFGNNATAPTAFGAGDTYYNKNTNRPCYYNGTSWNYYNNNSAGC